VLDYGTYTADWSKQMNAGVRKITTDGTVEKVIDATFMGSDGKKIYVVNNPWGGNGTTYIENPSKLDIYYAHPDAAGNPGYFTLTPTAINATKVDATNASQQFYSLDGRTGKTRGLNIVRTQSKRPRKVLFK
jgi:hypothetical protein